MKGLRRAAMALAAVLLSPALPLMAQQGSEEGPLRGVVLDAVTHSPLPNAAVLLDLGRGVLTDARGQFVLPRPGSGRHEVSVSQFGYEEVAVEVQIPGASDLLEIELRPGPLALDGFTVVADRLTSVARDLEDRRLSTGEAVRLVGQDRLIRSGAEDVTGFLRTEAGFRVRSCEPSGPSNTFQALRSNDSAEECIFWRGIVMRPDVFVDDVRRIEGIHAFDKLPLYNLYLIEVISSGKMIRAYSNDDIQRLAETPQVLPRIVF